MNENEILIKSTLDGTLQPSLYYPAPSGKSRALLIGLHTWSYDRFNQVEKLVPVAAKYDLNLILPEFRGANLDSNPRPDLACASEYAMRDIKDAADWAVSERGIDPAQIMMYGESGGGHMALMMAGYCPEYFEAIASVVPITDLEKWAEYSSHYRRHVLACCGGDRAEMAKRSPVTYIDSIAKANVRIFHGKYDTSVPVSHSISLFGMITDRYPQSRVFLDIFDGGHQTDMNEVMYWLMSQHEKREKGSVTG